MNLSAKRLTLVWSLVVMLIASLGVATGQPVATADTGDKASFTSVAPPTTVSMSIDVLGTSLTENSLELSVTGSSRSYLVPMFGADYGLTTQVLCDPGTLTITASAPQKLEVTLMVSFLDEEGLVLATYEDTLRMSPTIAQTPEQPATPAPQPVVEQPKAPVLLPATAFTPTISGSLIVTQKLTASANLPSGWKVSGYQWFRGSAAIAGATASTYIVTAKDVNLTLSVRVIATRDGYKDGVGTSAATSKVAWNYLVSVDKTKLLSKHYTVGRTSKIDKIVIHHNAGNLSIDQVYNVWQTREASAHYQVQSDGKVGRLVADGNTAWHAGNWQANVTSIGIEHANNTGKAPWTISDSAIDSGGRLVAELSIYYGLGRPTWMKTVYPHSYFSSTSCPGELSKSQQAQYMARAQYWYDQLIAGA